MHLLAPWWLLLYLPLAGLLILLYLLKLRRRDFFVPSVFLWEQALHDLQANAPLQKLRTHLLLLLQLLALLLLVLALCRPAKLWSPRAGRQIVLIVDCSASMQCTDVSPSRFAVARTEAGKIIEGLGPHDALMLLAIGSATRALTPFTTDQRALRAALGELTPGDTRADFRGALDLVSGLLHHNKLARHIEVVFISDGAIPPTILPADFHIPIHFIPVGRRGENVGIVVMDMRRQLREAAYEGIIVMKNFGAKTRSFTLEETLNGTLRDARAETLAAGEERTEIVKAQPANGGVFRARLDIADDLAVDNSASQVLPPMPVTPVTLVSSGNYFLKTALSLDPTLRLSESATVPLTASSDQVLICDGVAVPALPGVSALIIGPRALGAGSPIPATLLRQSDADGVVDWDRRHPVLSHVDLTGLQLAHAAILTPRPSAHVLIEAQNGPVSISEESAGRRLIYLGWDLQDSDFPLRATFPIFLRNAINWLSRRQEVAQAMNVRTGQVVHLPVAGQTGMATITDPAGHTQTCEARDGMLLIDDVQRVGAYRVQLGKTTQTFYANLLDAEESRTQPQTKLPLTAEQGKPVVATAAPVQLESEWWRYLLLLALLVLGVEWWVFHRRIG